MVRASHPPSRSTSMLTPTICSKLIIFCLSAGVRSGGGMCSGYVIWSARSPVTEYALPHDVHTCRALLARRRRGQSRCVCSMRAAMRDGVQYAGRGCSVGAPLRHDAEATGGGGEVPAERRPQAAQDPRQRGLAHAVAARHQQRVARRGHGQAHAPR